jgi:hypothetical protein
MQKPLRLIFATLVTFAFIFQIQFQKKKQNFQQTGKPNLKVFKNEEKQIRIFTSHSKNKRTENC